MAKVLRFILYGWIVGMLVSALFFVRFIENRRSRVLVVREVLGDQLKAIGLIENNEALVQDAERIKYGQW
mgnify:FL=1